MTIDSSVRTLDTLNLFMRQCSSPLLAKNSECALPYLAMYKIQACYDLTVYQSNHLDIGYLQSTVTVATVILVICAFSKLSGKITL